MDIRISKPTLPDLQEFIPYLEDIWESRWLTNKAKYHQQLEKEMADFLGVKYVALFANGTLALVTALQALNITGDVITTPYSFVATTHSLWWNNITPVFVDIEPEYCNINSSLIEKAITPQTTAILPVHVYGNPCNVEQIKEVADKHKLKVIYDAAHAFGHNFKGQSLLNWGALSILSFHATKPFNTMEGGAIICHDKDTKQRIDYLKNFGFANETEIVLPGINSKMNEMQAALGLLQLKKHKQNINIRQELACAYRDYFKDMPGISLMHIPAELENNSISYFPIFVEFEKYGKTRDELYEHLIEQGIYGRRYFYPLISQFRPYSSLPSAKPENLPVAEKLASRVICLPIYPELDLESVKKISILIKEFAC